MNVAIVIDVEWGMHNNVSDQVPVHSTLNFAACSCPTWSHTNFVSSSLFLLWAFRWKLGQSPPRWKRTPQQTQMCSKKEHLVKNPQPYLSAENQFPIISGNHQLSTDWKLVDFPYHSDKKACHAHKTLHVYKPLLPYCTSSTGPDFTGSTHR